MTFTYSITATDWGRIAPELVLAAITLILMLVDLVLPRTGGVGDKHSGPSNFVVLPLISILGILSAFAATIVLFITESSAQAGVNTGLLSALQTNAFNNMIGADWGSLYGYVIILSASLLAVLLSPAYLKRLNLVHQGEYYALIMLATIGMMLLAAASSFLTVFLGIEMLSLALYILCGFVARRKSSQESGMKYFLLSSFASAFLLYGIALTYGATGSTAFPNIHTFLVRHVAQPGASYIVASVLPFQTRTMLLVAMGLLAVGFAFKVSAIPFQAWTPDVYEGAPAPVTAFMSVATKAAAIIAFARVFGVVLYPVRTDWLPIVETITILTIVGGNILALVQSNVKRLLAYSSIAHAGYLLIGIVAASITLNGNVSFPNARVVALSSILFYLLCYTFLNMGAFGITSLLERADNSGNDMKDIRGLWYRQPVLAGFLAFFMLALAGFPPMAGFAGKYYLFYAALNSGHPELLVIGVLASVLGMYYYLRVIASMFMEGDSPLTQVLGLGTVPATPAPATASVSSVPATPRGVATAQTAQRSATGSARRMTSSGGTAVAVRTPSAGLSKTAPSAIEASTEQGTASGLNWMSWTSIGLAALGTLAMGTVLPFWLVNLAQQAAQMMMR